MSIAWGQVVAAAFCAQAMAWALAAHGPWWEYRLALMAACWGFNAGFAVREARQPEDAEAQP